MKRLLVLMTLSACLVPAAWAQSFCASDGQPTLAALVERFINADCPTRPLDRLAADGGNHSCRY